MSSDDFRPSNVDGAGAEDANALPADPTGGCADGGADPPTPADLRDLVYAELRRLAGRYLAGERAGHSLQPTELVHEAFLRLANDERAGGAGREHLLALGAQTMRRVLVDHARRHRAEKRGGPHRLRVTLHADIQGDLPQDLDVLELNELLEKLDRKHPRMRRVVEMRFFSDMSVEAAAEALGVSRRTAYQDWVLARSWLQAQLA